MSALYLFFGHLVADFMLQPQQLIRWKYKSWRGVAMHAFIHWLFYLLIFLPYLPDGKVLLVLFAVGATHFVIDLLKIRGEARSQNYLFFFLADQACHLGVILLSGIALADRQPQFVDASVVGSYYQNVYFIVGLSLLIMLSYVLEIVKYQMARQKNHGLKFKPDYAAMFKRMLVFAILYATFMIFGVYGTAAWGT